MRPVRTYLVKVEGFDPMPYCARTPAQARARAYRDYLACYDVNFRDFLKRSTIKRVPNPPGIGDRIMVGGLPATQVLPLGQYVGFMRDDSDAILCSHPADVTPIRPAGDGGATGREG